MFDFLSFKRKKKALTSKDIGTQLEERVVALYQRLGYFRVKRSVMVTDHFGNLSEIDVKAGIIFRRYIECKNYATTHAVPFSDVAKFKSVLELNDIPLQRAVFITASTFTPRCRTIGIKCIDGTQLARLERWSYIVRFANRTMQGAAVGAIALAAAYVYQNPIQLEKVKTWKDIDREYKKAERVVTAWYRKAKREIWDLIKPSQ